MLNTKKNVNIQKAVNSHPTGRGLRPTFDALWHLEELNVINDLTSFSSEAWDNVHENGNRPVVVVMDTPMDTSHPNLQRNIDRAQMRDFSVFNEGAFPVNSDSLKPGEIDNRNALAAKLQAKLTNQLERSIKGSVETDPLFLIAKSVSEDLKLRELEEESRDSQSPQKSVEQLPGAHGTAVAGLIAGKPATVPFQTAAYLSATNEPSETVQADLPYSGINPYANIVPISLTAAPYPDMVLGALTYIEAIKPDVIVIAAAWADPIDLGDADPEDKSWEMVLNERKIDFSVNGTPNSKPTVTRDNSIWAEVTAKIKSISKDSIVLCAAGNVDSDQLVYPACLCTKPDNNIWAVTACDTNGEKLSYAPGIRKDARMIKTLSTQLPRADQAETVVDPFDIKRPKLDVKHVASKHVTPRDIITLDPTGLQGYNPTEYPPIKRDSEEPYLEIGSLYARFSGTSAATAIAGGLVSLAISMDSQAPIEIKPDTEKLFDLDQARALFGLNINS